MSVTYWVGLSLQLALWGHGTTIGQWHQRASLLLQSRPNAASDPRRVNTTKPTAVYLIQSGQQQEKPEEDRTCNLCWLLVRPKVRQRSSWSYPAGCILQSPAEKQTCGKVEGWCRWCPEMWLHTSERSSYCWWLLSEPHEPPWTNLQHRTDVSMWDQSTIPGLLLAEETCLKHNQLRAGFTWTGSTGSFIKWEAVKRRQNVKDKPQMNSFTHLSPLLSPSSSSHDAATLVTGYQHVRAQRIQLYWKSSSDICLDVSISVRVFPA